MNTIYHHKKYRHIKLLLVVMTMLVALGAYTVAALTRVHASPVVGFNAGKVIDDGVFTNYTSMTPAQIQSFLNAKVPVCDTWHAPGYGQNPPFTCLKDFNENGRSAAQIIYDTAQQYRINPQVFIVLLQKEQGLVTDTWPLAKQYRTATGYGCPDTAPCDSQYYGLTNQLNWSGKMFRSIMDNNPNWYTPYVVGNNYIRWSPNSSCGGTTVNIQNRATQALYNYTPYQPNEAALNAGYGTGDACSAYGNRNFYLYFSDWFGSTVKPPIANCPETKLACVWAFREDQTGQFFYTSNIDERNAVNSGNYSYIGIHFFIRKDVTAGTIPLYRLYSPSGTHLWTTSPQERSQLLAAGWRDEGIAFNVDPPTSNTGEPVRRFYLQAGNGFHALTRDERYMAELRQGGYVDEGIAFTSISSAAQDVPPSLGKQNVYRFHLNNEHFWTISVPERDALIRGGAAYEGASWQTSENGQDVYRLYSPTGIHFWTISVPERDDVIRAGWKYEGVSWHTATSGSPIYRLYYPRTGLHFWTASSNERDGLLASPDWRNEDVSWRY